MQEEYNPSVAEHYAAFRPPLHRIILERLIHSGERFKSGLDIGCGTGYSTVALAKYCDHVMGIDPSESMIKRAAEHSSIDYLCGNEYKLSEIDSQSVDVTTFAGSIFYAKNDDLYKQLLRVLKQEGLLLIYDFEVNLDEPLHQLELARESIPSDYQFIVDLSDWDQFKGAAMHTEQIELAVSPEELSHLLLADSLIYGLIAKKLNKEQPFDQLVEFYQQRADKHHLKTDLYYARLIRQ